MLDFFAENLASHKMSKYLRIKADTKVGLSEDIQRALRPPPTRKKKENKTQEKRFLLNVLFGLEKAFRFQFQKNNQRAIIIFFISRCSLYTYWLKVQTD